MHKKKIATRSYLLIMTLLGVGALGLVFLREPTVSSAFQAFENAYQAGVRKGSLIFFTALVILGVFSSFIVFTLSHLKRSWFKDILEALEDFSRNRKWFFILIAVFILASFIGGQVSLSIAHAEDPLDRIFLSTLLPVFLWVCLMSFMSIAVLFFISGNYQKLKYPVFVRPFLIFLGMFILGFVLLRMGYGYTVTSEITGNFDLTGYPILGYQVLIAWFFTVATYLISRWIFKCSGKLKNISPVMIDVGIGIFLFLAAFILWQSAPLKPHMFWDQPRPPNYEIYPNSDALLYDRTAQGLLARGKFQTYIEDYREFVGLRPILTLYQAGLHKIGGLGYKEIISIQVGFFSLLPVLIYLFTSSLHSRLSGILASILIIIRERNGLLLGDVVTGVHSKLLMSEIPTMMGVILFLTLFVNWLKKPERRSLLAFAAGGVLGLTMLIRQETGIALPFLGLIALITLRDKFSLFLKHMMLLILGVILVITPWIWRNWYKSGEIFLDRPGNRLGKIHKTIELKPSDFPLEGSSTIPNQNNKMENNISYQVETGLPLKAGSGIILQRKVSLNLPLKFPMDDVGTSSTLELVINHYVNQWVQSVVYLPSNPLFLNIDYLSKLTIGRVGHYYGGFLYSPQAYVKSLPYWWNGWSGGIPSHSILFVSFTLLMFSFGLSGSWKKRHWIGLIPLAVLFAHTSIYALVRLSGGRFLQEADWISTFYFSVGLMEITRLGQDWWKGRAVDNSFHEGNSQFLDKMIHKKFVVILVPLLLISLGSLPTLVEYVLPNQYSREEQEYLVRSLENTQASPFTSEEQDQLREFLQYGGTSVYGRAFYPRFFEPGENLRDVRNLVIGGLEREPFSRSEFYLSGTDNVWGVVFKRQPPLSFPHGSDVLSIGCLKKGVLDTLVTVVYSQDGKNVENIIWRDGDLEEFTGCPLPPPD